MMRMFIGTVPSAEIQTASLLSTFIVSAGLPLHPRFLTPLAMIPAPHPLQKRLNSNLCMHQHQREPASKISTKEDLSGL